MVENYLKIQRIRLEKGEKWVNTKLGLMTLFLKTGNCQVGKNEFLRTLGPGDLFVCNCTGKHLLSLQAEKPAEVQFLSVRWDFLYPLFDVGEISYLESLSEKLRAPMFISAAKPAALKVKKILANLPKGEGLEYRAELLKVLSIVIQSEMDGLIREKRASLSANERVLKQFNELSAEQLINLPIGDLAKIFGCGRRHLNRLFQRHFGFSVSGMKMEMRLVMAATLLKDPNAKVNSVGELCGFNHPGLFNQCFKKRFKASPGEWRNQNSIPAPPAERQPLLQIPNICPLGAKGICRALASTGQGTQPNL